MFMGMDYLSKKFLSQEELCCAFSICFLAAHFAKFLEAITQVNPDFKMESLPDKVPAVSITWEKISKRPVSNKNQQV